MYDIEPLARVLSESTLYNTAPVFSRAQGLLTQQLNFSTLNEELVIQRMINNHQTKKAQEQSLWRWGGALVGLCFGLGDGFQLGDMVGSAIGASMGSLVGNELNLGDEATLRELNLEWVNTPESYLYHRKRHRGEAIRRLLLILPHPDTGRPCASFGVQFPDGYVAHLGILRDFDQPLFSIAGSGFDTDWIQDKQTLGMIPTDIGMSLPVEFWRGQGQNSLIAIPYRIPHHCMY